MERIFIFVEKSFEEVEYVCNDNPKMNLIRF